jgi:hypothetical protein
VIASATYLTSRAKATRIERRRKRSDGAVTGTCYHVATALSRYHMTSHDVVAA